MLEDGTVYKFGERIDYDSYPREISEIKNRRERLMDKVIEQWQRDKLEIPTFKI